MVSAAAALDALRRGDVGAARALVDRLAPTDQNAPLLRLRLALALIEGEQLVEAIQRLDLLARDVPHSKSAWQALGAALRAADDVAGAATAFDRVLALDPADPNALTARAQMAADLGRPTIAAWQAALAVDPASTPARLGLAAALAQTDAVAEAEAMVRGRLAQEPAWREGWDTLLTLVYRWQGEEPFIAAAREAFDAGPRDGALMLEVLRLLAKAGQHETALAWATEVRARIGDSPPLQLVEAEALDRLGESERASLVLERLAPLNEPTVDLARVCCALRRQRPEQAADIAGRHAQEASSTVWLPYLGTAWRLAGDRRCEWLEGDPDLVGVHDLGLSAAELSAIAACLTALHAGRHPPFQQSMRGGTQTEGNLLSREEPELRRLRAALTEAVHRHAAQLPPLDPTHPFLRMPRDRFRFMGSWSVRLLGGGRHVNHIHSDGWLSSACYIALSSTLGDDHAGWLTLGQPPEDLRTGLQPTRQIRPVVGRIALFPSTMWHGTVPFAGGERLTVAFDVKPLA